MVDGLSGINRHVDRAQAEYREVRNRPLRPVLRKQGDAIAGLDSQISESEGHVADALNKSLGGNVDPLTVDLVVKCVLLAMLQRRLETESRY